MAAGVITVAQFENSEVPPAAEVATAVTTMPTATPGRFVENERLPVGLDVCVTDAM
jgi:hypothetical protein